MTRRLPELEIVGLLYEAASNALRWPDALEAFARTFDGGAAVVALVDPRYTEASIAAYSPAFSPTDIAYYQNHLMQYDRVAPVLEAPAGKIVTDEDVWPDRDEFRRNPVVRWRKENFGLPHAWGMNLNGGEGWQDAILVQTGETPWPLHATVRNRVRRLHPHVSRALRLARLYNIAEARYRQFAAALDRLSAGVLLLRPDGTVAFANEEALRIAEECGCFSIARDRIRTTHASDQTDLQARIADALSVGAGAPSTSGGGQCTLAFRQPGERALVEVTAIRDDDVCMGALVVVVDPTNKSTFRLDGLQTLFALTNAEAAVCELLTAGYTNRQIAEARNTEPSTVRDQLSSVFAKTGKRNRHQLLRLVFKINPPFER